MDANPMPAVHQHVSGYSRAEVDEFLSATAAERARLEAEIDESTQRISRARTALAMHKVMVAMLLETQLELGTLRRDAEAEARQIVADAESDAHAILRGVSSSPLTPGADSPFAVVPEHVGTDRYDVPTTNGWGPTGAGAYSSGTSSAEDDEYFNFLRGALSDDGPFGPSES